MSLFDELKIRNRVIDGEAWVSLKDISSHTLDSVRGFIAESVRISLIRPASLVEEAYIRGIAEGMISVANLLSQGGVEAEFDKNVNTVEDLLKTLEKKMEHDDQCENSRGWDGFPCECEKRSKDELSDEL
jgi:hypothetical protein